MPPHKSLFDSGNFNFEATVSRPRLLFAIGSCRALIVLVSVRLQTFEGIIPKTPK